MRSNFILAFVFGSMGFVLQPAASAAAETCHNFGGQYADTRFCVTSVLPPQGRNSYGPDQISGLGDGAWCEGVPGPGIGQSVTVHQNPAQVIGSMSFVNGYARTEQTFRNNGRVKRARIETSGGYVRTMTFRDGKEWLHIKITPSNVTWVRLTILETYPGARDTDTCISKFYMNHEEFGALEEPSEAK